MSSQIGGIAYAVPAKVTGVIRRFWEFTIKTALAFGKQLKDPEERAEEFVKAVRRDSENWT